MLFIWTCVVAEFVAFLFYSKFKQKFKKLRGSGRMADIEIAHNWQTFFRLTMFVIPVLMYMLKSSIE
jgi:hypothetical protein